MGVEKFHSDGEKRLAVSFTKSATMIYKPNECYDIRRREFWPELDKGEADFICLNYWQIPDMVGHTGVMSAAIKALWK